MRVLICFLPLSWLLLASPALSAQPDAVTTLRQDVEASTVFARGFTGFVLLDAETGETLCDLNGDKYFTPASNLKILTLATCLSVLGDSVPGMQARAVSLDHPVPAFRPTADPTFLHPDFSAWQPVRDSMRQRPLYILSARRFLTTRYAEGWAWEDEVESYQPERSPMPIYGNVALFQGNASRGLDVFPPAFRRSVFPDSNLNGRTIIRNEHENRWYYASGQSFRPGFKTALPFRTDDIISLLGDTLHALPLYQPDSARVAWRYIYSAPLDTVLRRMMYQSDNFIAEQMLLVCAGVKYDVLYQDTVIRWAKDVLFNPANLFPLPGAPFPNRPPRWVDGSGLSRYNLITPRYIGQVLRQMWCEQTQSRLFSLFPTAGAPETTLDWWAPKPAQPWLFAKTGSMSGVQCLSGYLVTKSGRVLVFSFMHNNFVGSSRPWRLEMKRLLEKMRDL